MSKKTLLLMKAKRRQIIWQIEDGLERLERKRQKLIALSAAIARLDNRFDPRQTPSPHLRHRPEKEPEGAIIRRIISAMRRANGPVSSAAMVRAVPLPGGCKTIPAKRIWALLTYLVETGRVVKTGRGRKAKWALEHIEKS